MDVIDVKRCPKCGQTKSVEEFSWKDRYHTERAGWCRPCVKARARQTRLENIERYRAVNRAWNERNAEQLRERANKYYYHVTRARRARQRWIALGCVLAQGLSATHKYTFPPSS